MLKNTAMNKKRPKFEDIKSGVEFNHWYWLKEELEAVHTQLFTESRFTRFRKKIYHIFKNS